ncbi:LLM class flavin-dependent oxidoreductase [Actinomadura sp. LD22]|uniref:LLM class flavin-dependent oxidoreductase n=1 Tax=Actinomadura physcomitrii TaxID=2650748 RepID=A0A6I4MAC3_9ACTN|nr:LLM class flavin-dependent oxidoreductase [Actinomadura physcomitrii]MWA03188.1 LLM class flavin-dependent oxidoreductase [Actinomadura physcomitrii]
MDFGLFYEVQVASPFKHRDRERQAFHDVMDQAVHAEQAGFESFWTVEHHFQPGFSHSSAPEVLYGAISQRTSALRIGHGVALLPYPYNHPVRVAERAATLDILSNGRVELGTGKSITLTELGGFGIPYDETSAMWQEALEVITAIWKSETGTFSHSGKYFDIPERTVVPMPVQDPHPPIWSACTSLKSHVEAGEKGLGLLTFTVLVRPEEVGRRVRAYREAVARAEPMGAAVNDKAATFTLVHCADTDEQAREEAEAGFMSYVQAQISSSAPVLEARKSGRRPEEIDADEGFQVTDFEGIDPRDVDLQYLIDNGMCVVGSPDTCVKQIERLQREADLDKLLCMMQFWSLPHDRTMHAIELLGKHVIPCFA